MYCQGPSYLIQRTCIFRSFQFPYTQVAATVSKRKEIFHMRSKKDLQKDSCQKAIRDLGKERNWNQSSSFLSS